MSVGIPARSLAVARCGGTTPLANLLHAAVLLVIRWLGSGLVSDRVKMFLLMWGRLETCGRLATRLERR